MKQRITAKKEPRLFFATAVNNKEYMDSLILYGAFEKNILLDIIATRNMGSHIALFFVQTEHQKKGVGRKLFDFAIKRCPQESMGVNSSPYAKEIYHHLGFVDSNKEQTVNGIRFIPMIYNKKID